MPYDESKNRGTFEPHGKEGEYVYSIESWVREGQWPEREKSPPSESDLIYVDFLITRVHPVNDASNVHYDTVWGPLEKFDMIEGFLAYDFGDEGSIEIV